jgi:hypothetical protein
MKLQDFIVDALMEIQYGVQQAIDRQEKQGGNGRISPVFQEPGYPGHAQWTELVEKVEFDVAVTEANSTEASGGGGLEILSVAKIGAKGTTTTEHGATNRIRFSVSVILPGQKTDRRGPIDAIMSAPRVAQVPSPRLR